jgi:hypothetical protein
MNRWLLLCHYDAHTTQQNTRTIYCLYSRGVTLGFGDGDHRSISNQRVADTLRRKVLKMSQTAAQSHVGPVAVSVNNPAKYVQESGGRGGQAGEAILLAHGLSNSVVRPLRSFGWRERDNVLAVRRWIIASRSAEIYDFSRPNARLILASSIA